MAWTDRYVRADAAGGGDGTTDAASGANGAWTLAEGITNEAAGMRLNVKAGTYANTTTTRTLAGAGTATAPIWWRGFKATAGDQDTNRAAVAGTDIPLLTYTTGQMVVSGANHILSNLAIMSQCTTANGALSVSGASPIVYGIRAENTAANSNARAITMTSGATGGIVVASWFKATSSATVASMGGAGNRVHGCAIVGGNVGLALAAATNSAAFCVVDGSAGDAITVGSSASVTNCSVYGPGGHGINVTSANSSGCHISNCHLGNCNQASKAGIANTSGTDAILVHSVNNSFYNCTSNTSGITESFAIFDKGTLAGSGYTNAAGRDFTASTYLKAIGYPGVIENETETGYLDNGALQRQEPAGGSVAMPVGGRICS